MANWYDKYMTVYGKPFAEVPEEVIKGTRERLARLPPAGLSVGYQRDTM